MPQDKDPISKPTDWDKCVSVAYLRYMGASQVDAATVAGVVRETVSRWERSSWWPDAQKEAEDRWLSGLAQRARAGLERAVADDGNLSLKVLERIDRRLAPPKAGMEHEGEVTIRVVFDE